MHRTASKDKPELASVMRARQYARHHGSSTRLVTDQPAKRHYVCGRGKVPADHGTACQLRGLMYCSAWMMSAGLPCSPPRFLAIVDVSLRLSACSGGEHEGGRRAGGRASPQAERWCCRHSDSCLLRGPCVRGEVSLAIPIYDAGAMETTGECATKPHFSERVEQQ